MEFSVRQMERKQRNEKIGILKENKLPLREFLMSLGLNFANSTMLPVVLLENVDLQTLNFTNETIAKEIY